MPSRRSSLLSFVSPLVLFVLSACSYSPQTTLDPKSTTAVAEYDLLVPIFWAAVVVFVIVEALLVISVLRFRVRGDPNAIPVQFHGNTPLEIGWTIAPAIVLGIIFLMTAQTLNAVHAPASSQAGNINVRTVGHQWWWEFQYPDLKTADGLTLTVASDLHIPAGKTVNYTLESVDVIHSFWVPQLGGKTDLIPGHTNRGFFVAPQPGPFLGQCAEFCGEQHAQMRFHVYADNPGDFDAWVRAQQATPPESAGDAKAGRDLFAKSACIGCHNLAGATPFAEGKIGPNLTHFGSRTSIGAGVLPNNADNLRKWLHDPGAIKPGNDMATPMRNIIAQWGADADKNIEQLVVYLESLK